MLPEGWRDAPLSQLLAKVIDYRGQSVPKSENGVPLITARNVRAGFLDFSAKEYVPEDAFEAWMSRGVPSKGDILFTTEAPLGNVCRYPETGRYAVGQRTVTLRPDKSKLDAEYLLYFLLSEKGQRLIDIRSSGSTAKGIKSAELKKVRVTLPCELPEQKKIAQILSTWDQAITATERLLENSQQRKKGLMQQLLTGKKRLPGFEGEWEKVQLKKLGKCIRGVSYKPSDICNEVPTKTVRLLRSTNIQNGSLNDKDLVILPNASVKSEQLLKAGDLCICMANGSKKLVGKSAVFHDSERPYTVGAFCAIYRTLKTADSRFVRFLFESSKYEQQISVILAGSSINNLKGSDIESMWFNAPVDPVEQTAIADVLSSASREIRLLANCLNKLKEEKKALMQQLLTGKRRVRVDTEAA